MSDAREVVPFLHEAGHLKRSARQGWWIAGINDPESVAEHSFRTAIVAYVIATLEGADAERSATLALFHDLPETRLGDIPSTKKRYVSSAPAEQVIKDQTANLPAELADRIRGLVSEFEEAASREALCAKDADKLECLLQAREYQMQGFRDVQPWVDTMVTAMRTGSGKALAAAALETAPNAWWHDIVSSYGRKTMTDSPGADAPVAAAVVVDDDRVLLVRRVGPTARLVWQFPAGAVEPGETNEQAAVRMAQEDTGVLVKARYVLGEGVHPGTGQHTIYIACDVVDRAVQMPYGDEIAAAAWLRADEVIQYVPDGFCRPAQEYLDAHLAGSR